MNKDCELVAPVFQEYRDILVRFIQSRVNDPLDREELLSEVMMKVYNHCEKLNGVRSTEAWLVTIAKNTITDFFREKQKSAQAIIGDIPVPEDDIGFMRDLEDCVPALINKLPEKYARPLADYELRGISQKSLAIQYQMSESGLKSRVQRGRKMLKNLFYEYCGHRIIEGEECGSCRC